MSQPKLNSKTESVLLSLFVPVCASNGAELLLSALKWPKRVKCHQAETREVAHYQELTRMIQIPSLAPFLFLRLGASDRDNPFHLQAIFYFPSLRPLRQFAPRFDPLGLKSVRVFVYSLPVLANF